MKRLLAGFVSVAILLNTIMIFADESENGILFLEAFDNLKTNAKVRSIDITAPHRVDEMSYNNKALLISDENVRADINANFKALSKEITTSLNIKYDGAPLHLSIGVTDKTSYVSPVTIENGSIISDNKTVGYINQGEFIKLSVAYDFKNLIYRVYKDDQIIFDNGVITTEFTPKSFIVTKYYSEQPVKLWLDNICVKNGMEQIGYIENGKYDDGVVDYIYADKDAGDYKYFDNNEMNTGNVKYTNVQITSNKNLIDCKRFDYKNKNLKKYILMEKSTSDDAFIDISIKKQPNYSSNKTYQNFIASTDLKIENLGAETELFSLIDARTDTIQVKDVMATITKKGDIQFKDGEVKNGVFNRGRWVNFKIAIDLSKKTADVYINNKLVKSGLEISSKINTLTNMKIYMNAGEIDKKSDLYIDNCSVWGTVNPYQNGSYVRTDIFGDDSNITSYLKDKVSFHTYANIVYVNNEKTSLSGMSKYDEDNNELYLSDKALKIAFGIDSNRLKLAEGSKQVFYDGKEYNLDKETISSNGSLMVSVKEFSTKVLGKYKLDDSNGMIIFANKPINIDLSNEKPIYEKEYLGGKFDYPTLVESMNMFLFYERPNSSKLKQLFNESTNNGKQHPRIIATKSDFERIKTQSKTDERLNKMKDALIKQADELLPDSVAPVDFIFGDQYRMIGEGGKLNTRMQLLGFAYKMTGEKKYSDRAWKELESVSKFPNLNPNHPLDTGMFTVGLAIGYDWFYDVFTKNQKDIVKKTIIELSLKPMSNAYYGGMNAQCDANPGWLYAKWTSNYNPIINGGTMLGAIAVAEECPDLSFDYIEKTLKALEYYFKGLAPYGAWVEGYSYWAFALSYLQPTIKSLDATFKTDFGLMKNRGLDKTANYAIALQGSTGVNNFSDADFGTSYGDGVYTWLSELYDNRAVGALRKWFIDNGAQPSVPEMFSYNPNIDVKEANNIPKGLYTKGTESFAIRNSYDDKNSLYLSAHFGNTGGFHAHMDAGTFVLDMLGERWAVDLGKGNYNRKYPQTEEYRYRSESHNMLVINPDKAPGQKFNIFAPLINFASKTRGGYAIGDLSQVYEGVNSAHRGFLVTDDMKSVIVRDELELKQQSTVYWFMTTGANVIIDNGKAILMQNGKAIILNYQTNATTSEIMVMDSAPLETSPNPVGQPVENATRKVAIKLTGEGKVDLTVKISEMGTKASGVDIINTPMSEWSIPDGEIEKVNSENLGCKVYSDGEEIDPKNVIPTNLDGSLPTITVSPNNSNLKYEIKRAEDKSKMTEIKIYSQDEKYFNAIFLKYSDRSSGMLKYYNEIPISSYSVSSTTESQNSASKMFDSNFKTRWTSLKKGEFVILDFGEKTKVGAISMAFWQGAIRKYNYDIKVSDNGTDWKDLLSGVSDGLGENYSLERFDTQNTRFIKIIGQGNSANVNTNILELRALKLK